MVITQFVEITVVDESGLVQLYTSTETSIINGVVQDSILGPTLFLLFINNIPSSETIATVWLFAEKTSLLVTSSDPDELEQISFSEAINLFKCFDESLLVSNSGKTDLINFCRERDCNRGFSLHLWETEPEGHPTESVRFMRLVLDKKA